MPPGVGTWHTWLTGYSKIASWGTYNLLPSICKLRGWSLHNSFLNDKSYPILQIEEMFIEFRNWRLILGLPHHLARTKKNIDNV